MLRSARRARLEARTTAMQPISSYALSREYCRGPRADLFEHFSTAYGRYCAAEAGCAFVLLRGFDLGGFFFDQFDEVVDDVGVFKAVVGEAADEDLVGAVAAAGEADIGLARFARAVDDAADDRDGEPRRDVREPLLEPLDGLDDLELLAGAGMGRRSP
jgi:hypothetical protein